MFSGSRIPVLIYLELTLSPKHLCIFWVSKHKNRLLISCELIQLVPQAAGCSSCQK